MRCAKTALVADVLQFLIRKAQHLLGLCDTEVPDIGMDADPELLLEHTGKMELADKLLLSNITFSFAYIQLVELHPWEYATAILFHLDCSLEFYLPGTTWKL